MMGSPLYLGETNEADFECPLCITEIDDNA